MLKRAVLVVCALSGSASLAYAQVPPAPAPQEKPAHDHQAAETPAWRFMQDGVVFGVFNHQGGPRGGDEFFVPNWWMGLLMREHGRHQFGFNAMLSLDPLTVGKNGYREIFQVGEALDGKPLVDRQHPHDLFMQLAASWRTAMTANTSLVLAGGPVGEPTLGPVAFMHRPSAAGLVMAPLGHHTFDSTHLSFGVISAALDHGRWTFEGSVFNAREPDDNRWDLETGRLGLGGRPSLVPAIAGSGGAGIERPVARARGTDPGRRDADDGVPLVVSARRSWLRGSHNRLRRQLVTWRAAPWIVRRVHSRARGQFTVRPRGRSAGRDGAPADRRGT